MLLGNSNISILGRLNVVSANVPDLLKNVRSNMNDISSSNILSLTRPPWEPPPLTVGTGESNNLSKAHFAKAQNINFDALISSAAVVATSQRLLLERMNKAADIGEFYGLVVYRMTKTINEVQRS